MIAICATLLWATVAQAQSTVKAEPEGDLRQQLITRNEAFVAALKNHDAKAVKSMISKDYIAVDPYFPYMLVGDDVIADEFVAWDNYFKRANGDEVLVRSEAQPRVRKFGDVAILTYVELDAVKTRGERMRGGRAGKCTFVYHRENGAWILVNSEITDQVWPGSVLLGNGQ